MESKLYQSLTRITESLLEQKDIDNVFKTITHTACSFFNASASSIMLFDINREYLTIAHSYNLSPEYLSVVKVHKDEEIAGKVCQTKKARFVSNVIDLFKEAGDDFTVSWVMKEGIISLVCAPLIVKDMPIGCLNIYYRDQQSVFSDESVLDFFTRLAALSIEYSKLTQQTEEKTRILRVLEEVGLLLTSSFNINEIMEVFLSTAVSIAHADAGGLILIDENEKKVYDAYEYVKGTPMPKRYNSSARLTEGISAQIMKTRKPVAIADLSDQTNIQSQIAGKKRAAVAGIPLITRQKMIGILYVDSYTSRKYTRSELDYLTILCSQAAVALDNTQLYKKITREVKELALLYEVSQSFISTLDFDRLLKNILQRLKETFGYLNLAIMLVDEKRQELYPHSFINYPEHVRKLRFKIGTEGITGYVAYTKKPYYAPDVSKDPYYRIGVEEAQSELCFPLMIGERLIGILDVESPEVNGFSQDDIKMLSGLSAQIAIALENSRLYEEAKELSLTDPLTNMPNRRSFELFLDSEIKRATRYQRKFSILMVDFDNFKEYNDTFGHPAGDEILKKFSAYMKDTIRDVDFIGRYGGDEFIAVLPETDRTFALEVAERMRNKIAMQHVEPNITLSVGIASFPQDSTDKSSLIELADLACYEAKELGGNCVNFASTKKEFA
jgi:diguanylate cyclase (GGDEF)-like protein